MLLNLINNSQRKTGTREKGAGEDFQVQGVPPTVRYNLLQNKGKRKETYIRQKKQ